MFEKTQALEKNEISFDSASFSSGGKNGINTAFSRVFGSHLFSEKQKQIHAEQNQAIYSEFPPSFSGTAAVTDDSSFRESLIANLKPVLMGVLKDEIFEEGVLSYEF